MKTDSEIKIDLLTQFDENDLLKAYDIDSLSFVLKTKRLSDQFNEINLSLILGENFELSDFYPDDNCYHLDVLVKRMTLPFENDDVVIVETPLNTNFLDRIKWFPKTVLSGKNKFIELRVDVTLKGGDEELFERQEFQLKAPKFTNQV